MQYGNIKRDGRGYTKYEFQQGRKLGSLTPRMKVLGDLASLGLKDKEILKFTKIKPSAHNVSHTCMSRKDDMVLARTNSEVEKMVEEAKGIIQRASVRAALNYEAAVEEGDLKASGKVLDLCGAFTKQVDTNINVSFGSWLKGAQNRDEIMNITPNTSLPEPLEVIAEGTPVDSMPSGCERLGDISRVNNQEESSA